MGISKIEIFWINDLFRRINFYPKKPYPLFLYQKTVKSCNRNFLTIIMYLFTNSYKVTNFYLENLNLLIHSGYKFDVFAKKVVTGRVFSFYHFLIFEKLQTFFKVVTYL